MKSRKEVVNVSYFLFYFFSKLKILKVRRIFTYMKYMNMIPIRSNRSTRMSDMTLKKSANIFVVSLLILSNFCHNRKNFPWLWRYLGCVFRERFGQIHWCQIRTYGDYFGSSTSKLSRWFLQKEKIAFEVYTDKELISRYKDFGKKTAFLVLHGL